MKIKKMFSLVSIASLALLMTGCKNSKNDGILDTDTFAADAITLEDYKNEVKAKKEVVKIFEGLNISDNNSNKERGIIVAYDDDKYYVYNILLENPKLLEFDKNDVNYIRYYYNSSSDYLYVRFKANDDGDYGYAYYTADGKCLLEKTYLEDAPSVYFEAELTIKKDLLTDGITARKYCISYETKNADDEIIANNIFYYSTIDETKAVVEYKYYLADEFETEFKNLDDIRYDGAAIGLKGYTIQIVGSKYYIFKKDKLVNVISFADKTICDNGCALYQVVTEVGVNNKYDIYYGGKYMVVKTYKMDLLTSKVSAVKDFHYYLDSDVDKVYSKDEDGNNKEIKGTLYYVFDYKEKKAVVDSDAKLALVKGNGSIEVNKKLIQDGSSNVILDGKYYYSYSNRKTIVNDKNGKVIDIYDGYYFDGVKVVKTFNKDGDIIGYTFFDKDGKKVLYLTDVTEFSYNRYVGKNVSGEKVVAVIDNGIVKTASVNDFNVTSESEFLVKFDTTENYYTFYTYDDTLTKMNLEFDADDYAFGMLGTYGKMTIYSLENNNDDSMTLFYFK